MSVDEKPRHTNGRQSAHEKLMQTFRMPRELVTFLKAEAAHGGRDLTGHVVRWLEGVRAYFGLPEAATALLESDRRRLGMERFEYMLHVLFQRSLQLREKGLGFDAPSAAEQRRLPSETGELGPSP
jgi:hypothetical protein